MQPSHSGRCNAQAPAARTAPSGRSCDCDSSALACLQVSMTCSWSVRAPFAFPGIRAGQARAVQHDPAVGRRDRQLLTDFLGRHFHHFAHHEHARGARRQSLRAQFEGFAEASCSPAPRRGCPSRPGNCCQWPSAWNSASTASASRARRPSPASGCSRAAAPQMVDDLVLEDAGEPGLQRRLAGEAGAAFERGEQRFLHRVLGRAAVAQLQQRVAQQIGASRSIAAASVPASGQSWGHKIML